MKEESNKERIERKLRVLGIYVEESGYTDKDVELIDAVLTLVIVKKDYSCDFIHTSKKNLIKIVESYEDK